MKRRAAECTLAALLAVLGTPLAAQGDPSATQPSSLPASSSGEGTHGLLDGWLHELLDRDYPKARSEYEAVLQREEGGREPSRMLAFSRLFEIDQFVGKAERVTEMRQRMRELGGEARSFPTLPLGVAGIRRSLEALAQAVHVGAIEPGAAERIAELRKKIVTDVTDVNVLARPFLNRQQTTVRGGNRAAVQTQLEGLRLSLEDAKRRGDAAKVRQLQTQIDVHEIELRRIQPRRDTWRSYAFEIVRQRLDGKDERAARLEEAFRQTELGNGPMRRMRGPLEQDPRLLSQRTLNALQAFLERDHELPPEDRATLEACRDRARSLVALGQYSKARDLLWPVQFLLGRGQ